MTTMASGHLLVAAVTVLLQSDRPLQGEDPMETLFAYAIVTFFFVAGLAIVYRGAGAYRLSRLVANTPTEKARSMTVGRTELEGTAEPDGTVFERPFTDGECLYARWEISERRKTKDEDGDTKYEWRTLDSGEHVAPFELDDGTGRAEVAATGDAQFEISDENSTTISVGRGSPPARVQQFLSNAVDGPWSVSANPKRGRKQRYSQEVIPPGEEVYVFGAAVPKPAEEVPADATNAERLAVVRDEGTDRFVVSDMDEEHLTTGLRRRAILLVPLGLGISSVTLYLLASEALVVLGAG